MEFVSLIQFQHIFFIEAMGFRNTMGPSTNLQIKVDGHEKQKSARRYKIAYGKKTNIFSTAAIWLRGSRVALGITDGLVGLQIALGVLGGLVGSWVAIRGCRQPLGSRGVMVETIQMSNFYKCPEL
jgi:hypothetical protein